MDAQLSDQTGSLELLHHKLDRIERTIDNMSGNVAKLAIVPPLSTDRAAEDSSAGTRPSEAVASAEAELTELRDQVSRLQQEFDAKLGELTALEKELAAANQRHAVAQS